MREWIEFLFFVGMLCGWARLIVWAWRTELEQAEHLEEMQQMIDAYEAERAALEQYQDTRQRAYEALRKVEGDTRPVDARLQSHGRLRDARMD